MRDSSTLHSVFDESFDALIYGANATDSARQGPWAAQLDNRGATLTPPPLSEEVQGGIEPVIKRRRAWALRDQAARLLRPENPEKRGPSVCACGRTGHEIEAVGVHLSDHGTAWTSGTLSCRSGWLCPVCAPRRASERQGRVAEVYDAVTLVQKGLIPMVTLTVQHRKGMALADLKSVVQEAWRSVRQGSPWSRLKEKHQILGTITAPEVTYSAVNGWHFHMHIAVPCVTDRDGALEVGSWIVDRYIRYIRAAGYEALSQGQDVTLPRSPEDAARYLAKGVTSNQDITWELAGGANKRGKSSGLHPFDILEASYGNAQMVALWHEYAAAIKGTRSCVISAALAKKLGLDEDDDLEEPGTEQADEGPIGELPAYVWNAVMRKRMGSTILSIIEDHGPDAWQQALSEAYEIAGFDLITPTPPAPRAPHAPSARDIALSAICGAGFSLRKGGNGRSIQQALDQERGVAVSLGRAFVPPNLKEVMQLMYELSRLKTAG